MLRRVGLALALMAAPMGAAVWTGVKGPVAPAVPPGDARIWQEYGLKSAETASFGGKSVTVWQFRDTTGAYAGGLALKAVDQNALTAGDLVITCAGECDHKRYLKNLPEPSGASGPNDWLPAKAEVAGTGRYLLGPASVAAFLPGVPANAIGLQFSPEGSVARYQTGSGEATMAVLAYPTPQIARTQAGEFRKVKGLVVKRTGPLVAFVSGLSDTRAAWTLLNQVSYEADVTFNKSAEHRQAKSLANMLLSIFALAAIAIVGCLIFGLLFAGGRILLRRFGIITVQEELTSLHLVDK